MDYLKMCEEFWINYYAQIQQSECQLCSCLMILGLIEYIADVYFLHNLLIYWMKVIVKKAVEEFKNNQSGLDDKKIT